jgi:hypothetical protein
MTHKANRAIFGHVKQLLIQFERDNPGCSFVLLFSADGTATSMCANVDKETAALVLREASEKMEVKEYTHADARDLN